MEDSSVITRQELIERHLEYDSQKKSRGKPDTSGWNWDAPDELDRNLEAAHFKSGIIAGFRKWRLQRFDRNTLAESAVVVNIAKSLGTLKRTLGEFEGLPGFLDWEPDRRTAWFKEVESGNFSTVGLLIARPAVPSEHPALFYFEDGSGRAMAIFKQLVLSNDSLATIPVFVGEQPDSSSSFMRNQFGTLLKT